MLRVILLIGVLTISPVAHAAGGGDTPLPNEKWSFEGPFGSYDRGALQRGYQVYSQVCASCHAMKHLSYRNLSALGYSPEEVKAIAAQYSVIDGPDDEGEMFERAGKPSDKFKSPFENDNAAKFANSGSLPPDLSLITKARVGGADYIYALLTGYKDHAPKGEELGQGQYWNKYMPGHKIAMAPPLADEVVGYEDGSDTTLEQYSRDVAHFLTWAAEPEMEVRKRTGIKVLLFLSVFAFVMYRVKKKIWKNVKH